MSSLSNYAEVNGARLAYETAGSGDAIVLIHGFASDSRVWDDQMASLANHFRVVRYDIRGHGGSSLPLNGSYSHAEDLKALLDYLRIDRAVLVGQSMGGGIAIDFALTNPQAAKALILVDSTVAGYGWSEAWGESWGPVYGAAAAGGMEHALPLLLAHPLFATAIRQSGVKQRLTTIFSEYSGWHVVNDDPLFESDPPAIERLREIVAPTLILVGSDDLPDFHRIATTLQQGIPCASFMELQGIGHIAPMEAADLFNGLVLDFLAEL